MSEEIALAAADLATVEALRQALAVAETEIKVLRSLEQLDQALSTMSVVEIDSARARVDSALVPQLARMLGLCLIKDDGEVYNVVTWALGSAEPLGTMELILQRTEGKTPTQLRIEAEAEAGQLRQALRPFAAWARLALDQAQARDAVLRDADIVFKLDNLAITVGDLRRAVEASDG